MRMFQKGFLIPLVCTLAFMVILLPRCTIQKYRFCLIAQSAPTDGNELVGGGAFLVAAF